MRSRSPFRVLFSLLLALTLFAAACGDGENDGGTAPESTDSSSADAEDDDAVEPEPEPEPEPADEAPEEEDDAATSDMVDEQDASAGFGSEPICARWAENEALVDEFDLFDPDQTEAFLTMSAGLLDEAIGDAPGDIVDDLREVRAGFDDLREVLERYEYDFFAAADEIDAIGTAGADAASDRIDAWIAANCPEIDIDGGDDDGSSLEDDLATVDGLDAILGSETGRELFIDGMTQDSDITREQAECLLNNLDVELLSALAIDPDGVGAQGAVDLLDVLAGCGIEPDAFG